MLAQLPGFQVGGLDPKVDEIVVYWKGEFGPEAQAAVDEAGLRGVPVNVIPAPYSYDELRTLAGPLVEALAAKGIALDGYQSGIRSTRSRSGQLPSTSPPRHGASRRTPPPTFSRPTSD